VILRSTIPPKDSPVCSSTIETILIGHSSVVTSNWKSTATPDWVHPRLRSVVRWSCHGLCAGGAVALEALLRAKGIAFSRD
jgi:hypothetical protein